MYHLNKWIFTKLVYIDIFVAKKHKIRSLTQFFRFSNGTYLDLH